MSFQPNSNINTHYTKPITPTREIPMSMQLKIFFSFPSTWIGLLLSMFALVGLINTTVSVLTIARQWDTQLINTTSAKIINVEYNKSGGNNGDYSYQHYYEYYINNQKYQGVSYHEKKSLSINSHATIEYLVKSPEVSRIKGMVVQLSATKSILIFCFMLIIGLSLNIVSMVFALGEISYLKNGIVAQATIYNTKRVAEKNERFDIYVRFKTFSGTMIDTQIRTDQNKTNYEGREYPIIYMPSEPTKAMFLISFNREKINLIYSNTTIGVS